MVIFFELISPAKIFVINKDPIKTHCPFTVKFFRSFTVDLQQLEFQFGLILNGING